MPEKAIFCKSCGKPMRATIPAPAANKNRTIIVSIIANATVIFSVAIAVLLIYMFPGVGHIEGRWEMVEHRIYENGVLAEDWTLSGWERGRYGFVFNSGGTGYEFEPNVWTNRFNTWHFRWGTGISGRNLLLTYRGSRTAEVSRLRIRRNTLRLCWRIGTQETVVILRRAE
jgi:hypothetical protein